MRPDLNYCSGVCLVDLKLLASVQPNIKMFWNDAEKNNPALESFMIFPQQNLVNKSCKPPFYIDIKILKTWQLEQVFPSWIQTDNRVIDNGLAAANEVSKLFEVKINQSSKW